MKMELKQVDSIPLKIPEKDLLRRIGGHRGSRMSPRTRAGIEKAVREIRRHASPRAVYRILPTRNGNGNGSVTLDDGVSFKSERLSHVLDPCDRAAVFVVTIGAEVDRLIRRSMEKHPQYGFILDAAASVAAEASAEYVQTHIERMLSEDERTTLRYSPGYCDWPLKEQKALFKLLPHNALDVKLSESSLMSPRKSISGIIGICPADRAGASGNACAKCDRKNCPHRRTL